MTQREREIANLAATGMSNSEIAQRIGVSPATVKNHLANIFIKLNVHTRTAMAFKLISQQRETRA